MTATRLHRRCVLLVPAAGLAIVLAACSGGGTAPVATESSAAPSASPADTGAAAAPVSAPAAAAADVSPFTGRPGGTGGPVIVVKLDNTTAAQPHAGLRDADVVYVEEVEWGLTRIAAVFSSHLPASVGPVRSARITDIELIPQYGKPAFAYSGAQRKLFPALRRGSFYDVAADHGIAGYARVSGRRAPYNLFADPAKLLARAPKATTAKSVGFTFAAAVPAGGTPGTKARVPWPASSAGFDWNATTKTYAVSLNGRPARAAEGGQQAASTVVIQYVKQGDSGFGDRYGGKTPLAKTVGTGTGVVLRDGQAFPVTWSRPDEASGTTYTAANGAPLPFAIGQTWVLLVKKGYKVTIS
ncbi:MAG: DUF3048 domain-containing protein [Actinomycetota bacterium]|nr:MAG: DUF3048 domain-containing protein [Actinomycetota bacterium]